ncbi:MAG: hypothetical protein KH415_00865 [Clostridium sp.]|nr:hypothetical protein [Clostridium sp.]
MVFVPDEKELVLLSQIIKVYKGEYCLIRLTSTMLDKSIIDAGQDIRGLLKSNGIINYSSIIPGGDKHMLDAILISNNASNVTISYYKPKTKKGDPRFWIYGLKKLMRSNEMIYLTTYNGQVCVIPLVDDFFNLSTIENFFSTPKTSVLNECVNLIKVFANQDILSVSPYKSNPKDIGDTLERELKISPNSSKIADFKNKIELKAKRKGIKTKDTLFSMIPNWSKSNIQSSPDMILSYGYESKKYEGFIDLYVTVSNKPNNQNLFLDIDYESELLIQKHIEASGEIINTCVWTFDDLKRRLYEKHPETLWLVGEQISKNDKIYFRYESIEHTSSPIFSSFLMLISQGIITYDWRGRVKSDRTKYKDKGHCFRLKPSYRHLLFGSTEEIEI